MTRTGLLLAVDCHGDKTFQLNESVGGTATESAHSVTLRLFNQWEGWVQPQAKTIGLKGKVSGWWLSAAPHFPCLTYSCDYLQTTPEIWTVDHPLESELVGKDLSVT